MYNWLGAAESYSKALSIFPESDPFRKGEFCESSGYALYRASMQAEDLARFKDLIRDAIASHENAKRFYKITGGPREAARILRCDAMIGHLASWLASTALEKRRLLDESWSLAKESLKAFEDDGDESDYGCTYNRLWMSALLGGYFEGDSDHFKRVLKDGGDLGEKAVQHLRSTNDLAGLTQAYVSTSGWLRWYASLTLPKSAEKDELLRRATEYWNRARELSDKSALTEMILWAPGWIDLDWVGQDLLLLFERALEIAREQKDNLLIGLGLEQLAGHTRWKALAVDDPDQALLLTKQSEELVEQAGDSYTLIGFTSMGASAGVWADSPLTVHYRELARLETDPEKKRKLLDEAKAAALDRLRKAEQSGYPWTISEANHESSKTLTALAKTETEPKEKTKLLEEALRQRYENLRIYSELYPSDSWSLGAQQSYLADLMLELATIAGDSRTKQELLREAALAKETCLKLCEVYVQWTAKESSGPYSAWVGERRVEYGGLWSAIHDLTGNSEYAIKAAEAFEQAALLFERVNLASRVAESYWKAARAYDLHDERLKAAQLYSQASASYGLASERIPRLSEFYQGYRSYMDAWSQIEKARHYHSIEDYGVAKQFYEKALNLHKSSTQWSYLAPNYAALSQVENAEDLSRREKIQDSIDAFKNAATLFGEAKLSLQTKLNEIDQSDQKAMITSLIAGADLRSLYCSGRIMLEEAKSLDKTGNHRSSSDKYGAAARAFETITASLEEEPEKRELRLITLLAKAWQMMSRAEEEASPVFYQEASRLFEDAKELCSNEKARSLSLGHARFCRALEAGTRLADTGDPAFHIIAMKQLESASQYYLRAGLEEAPKYAEATERLFDAYLNIGDAKRERDPDKKARLYKMIEKLLQSSAESFQKANDSAKREQVLRLMQRVKQEREFAISLSEVIQPPSFVSSTKAFAAPAPTREVAVGLDRFERSDVQVSLTALEGTPKVGEDIVLDLALVNTGRGPAQLLKIEHMIPEGFELTQKPEAYFVEDSYLNMKGKWLKPLKTEEIRLVVKPKVRGHFTLRPRIVYLDETGDHRSHEPEPLEVTVGELPTSQPGKDEHRLGGVGSSVDPMFSPVMEFLAKAFADDYMVKRLASEHAGWRSLTDISGSLNVPKSRVYGDPRTGHTFGKPLEILVKAGIVEYRIVPGARGRGGNVMKVRVAYDREPVKKLVDSLALRALGPQKNAESEKSIAPL